MLRVLCFLAAFFALLSPAGCADSVSFGSADGGGAPDLSAPAPQLTRDGMRSGRRLRIQYMQGLVRSQPDGSQVPVGLHDAELGVPCYGQLTTDGKRRCVPDGASFSGYFADPGCGQPLHAAPPCSPELRFALVWAGCRVEVFQVVPYRLGANLYRLNGAVCDTVPVTDEHRSSTWYTRGAHVAPESLIELADGIGAPQ
ncbi:MAG: hypothetical protein U1A78_41635 [Polyangia bacterium]